MPDRIEIVPEQPFEEGRDEGRHLGARKLASRTDKLLASKHLKHTLGAMDRAELERYVMDRLHAPPDTARYPELEDLHPERVERLRGLADGAGVSLETAAVADYAVYRGHIDGWHAGLQLHRGPGRCSGVLLVGPDGVIGAQSVESLPPEKRPHDYKPRRPGPYKGLRERKPRRARLTLRRPRTGYIDGWGTTNERGVGCVASVSNSTWLDEPIEDVWPIKNVPLLRFARDADHLAELYTRYTLFNWGRASQVWADTAGRAVVIEKSFRRIGVRRIGDAHALWCTEGYFHTPEMHDYQHRKRLEYVERAGKHAGADDLQYATDCAVRFAHIGELCHESWGRGIEHMRRVLCDHAPFPRAVCRHGGPDTDAYDQSVTMLSTMKNLTANTAHARAWVPWKRFACQVPEEIVHYPARPG